MDKVIVRNATKGSVVATEIEVADTSLTRLVGLIGRKELAPGKGLFIVPSSGVHTFFMSFPIDVVALDHDLRVVDLWAEMKPYRLSKVSLKVKSVLELPAGQIADRRIEVGDQLEFS